MKKIDSSCLITTFLFTGSHLLTLLSFHSHRANFDYQKLRNLDPDYIEQSFEFRNSQTQRDITIGLLSAIGWFVFCLPILQAAWHLSNKGTHQLPITLAIGALALGGSFSEMLSTMLSLGINNTIGWVSRSFELNGWADGDTEDKVGYRTVEVVHTILRGLLLWVDAMEWLFLFGIMSLLFLAVHNSGDCQLWNRKWATLGLVIGALSLLDFTADILRFQSWRVFGRIAFYISCGTRLGLMPVWLLWLGSILYKANTKFIGASSTPETEMSPTLAVMESGNPASSPGDSELL